MSYEVSIVADSVSPTKARITTFKLKYPRMIHAEFMTHRAISRNASSTRAIPTSKMLEWVEKDPAMPIYWGKNQKGMQADEELSEERQDSALRQWILARDIAVERAKALMDLGVHKQIASRVLEPFAHINVVATATTGGWMNYFALRCHKDAMPEMRHLAVLMGRAYRDSIPRFRDFGEWHLPFITDEEFRVWGLEASIKVSTAKTARTSYLTFDGNSTVLEDDVRLHDQLLGNGHWSPPEHPAEPSVDPGHRSGNFVGWVQYRQRLRKSVHTTFDFSTLDQWS